MLSIQCRILMEVTLSLLLTNANNDNSLNLNAIKQGIMKMQGVS